MISKLKRLYRKVRRRQPAYRLDSKRLTERHGSDYGGWNLLRDSLNADSAVVSFGIGNDISFDVSIIERYGCFVYAFDPTPGVAEWVRGQSPPPQLRFYPYGLAAEEGLATFYKPADESYVSHTQRPTQDSIPVEVPMVTLQSALQRCALTSVDLLKLDIEGFEYDVLPQILSTTIRPQQILVEFHHFMPQHDNAETEAAIELLRANGYELFDVSDTFCEYAFVYGA